MQRIYAGICDTVTPFNVLCGIYDSVQWTTSEQDGNGMLVSLSANY